MPDTQQPDMVDRVVFRFSELSDSAKDRARQWWREGFEFDFHSEYAIDDAAECGRILGIQIDHHKEYAVYWSGFWSQGDGACFNGSYQYAKGAAQAIRKHAPNDAELHRIADALQRTQRPHFYKLVATVRQSGRGNNQRTETEHSDDSYRDIGNAADDISQCMDEFAHWIYRQLEREHEYQTADAQVDESIEANEYEFDEEGRLA